MNDSKKMSVLFFGFLVLMQGCATVNKIQAEAPHQPIPSVEKRPPAEAMGPQEAFGPFVTAPNAAATPVLIPSPAVPAVPSYGPDQIQFRPVVLVLGPGLARGFAYAGVIQALKDAKVPIGAVLGTEMGALIGSMYVLSSSVNQFEWGLLKLKENVFRVKKGFLSKFSDDPSDGKKLEALLRQIFRKKDLSEAKIPLRIAIQNKDTGAPLVLARGNAAQAVRAALSNPKLFTSSTWVDADNNNGNEIQALSTDTSRPFLTEEARNLGLGPVVAINVLGEKESGLALDELKAADIVIKPDLKDIDYLDFQKKSDAAFRGKNAIIQHMSEIKHMVGMPDSDLDQLEKRSSRP